MSNKEHWENVYKGKSFDDVSWYQKEPLLSLDLINRSKLTADEAILDVGGGASVLIDKLQEKGFINLAVLDISNNALLSAKNRLGDKAEKINWYEADITQFNSPQPFALWHDRAVFHFLTDKRDREKYVEVLKNTLKAGGHLIIAAFSVGGPEKCSGLDIVQYDEVRMSAALGKGFSLLESRSETHVTPTDKEQRFTYFHYINQGV
ncbi:MAG: class I SAM-dependent methyltransferase [Gammaproteobacteria bacterium]|nr:class I SAM-dependent methyltransferase [Gammaproteobacteria bacterium]